MDIALAESAWESVPANAQGLVDAWFVGEGARVAAGQVLARVIVAKTTLEIAAPAAGVLEAILVHAGDNFARKQALARLKVG